MYQYMFDYSIVVSLISRPTNLKIVVCIYSPIDADDALASINNSEYHPIWGIALSVAPLICGKQAVGRKGLCSKYPMRSLMPKPKRLNIPRLNHNRNNPYYVCFGQTGTIQ